jgi:predicted glycoside hydrolase/deacetylase ChbG (UPF0249 family)
MNVVLFLLVGLVVVYGPLWMGGPSAESGPAIEADKAPQKQARLIVRVDDIGFCHAANLALERILEEGVCTSASVIVTTPWLEEAAAILRRHPEVSVGVHLTLNSEWNEYRWGPVMPRTEVPSLVDEDGNFFGTRRDFFAHNPKVDEVEAELRAQIELALRKDLRVSYVDYHMGTAVSTLEFQEVVEKLARRYGLGISQYFGETYAPTVYRTEPENKLREAIKIINGLDQPRLYLFVVHPGLNTPEMAALTDRNRTGVSRMAEHRRAETRLLCDPAFRAAVEARGLKLVGYRELAAEGLERMKRPWVADPYRSVQERTAGSSPPAD